MSDHNFKRRAIVPDDFVVPDDTPKGRDSEDYEPSIKVKHVAKDKGKKKEVVPKDEKRGRKQPQSTGVLREKPCRRCIRLKMECYNQTVGKVCLGCARVKVKCYDVAEGEEGEEEENDKGEKKEKKPRAKRQTKPTATKSRPANKKAISTLSSPATTPPPRATTSRRRAVSPAPRASTSKRRALSPAPQEPKAKRRATNKEDETRPGVDQGLREKVEELTKEVLRQRELLDAILPGYLRLKEAFYDLQQSVVGLDQKIEGVQSDTNAMDNSYRGTLRNHLKKLRTMDLDVKILKERMDHHDAVTEYDNDIEIIENPYIPANENFDDGKDVHAVEDVIEEWPANFVQGSPIEEEPARQEGPATIAQGSPIQKEPAREEESPSITGHMTQLDFTAPAPVIPSNIALPAEMPPPPPPSESDVVNPPPPNSPAVTIQPPTPHTSQENIVAEPATYLDVPIILSANRPSADPTPLPPSPSRSGSVPRSDPRRSPRNHSRSPSPLPASLLPRKRSADDAGHKPASKKNKKG